MPAALSTIDGNGPRNDDWATERIISQKSIRIPRWSTTLHLDHNKFPSREGFECAAWKFRELGIREYQQFDLKQHLKKIVPSGENSE